MTIKDKKLSCRREDRRYFVSLKFLACHWKWHQSIDHTWVPIDVP